MASAKEEMDEGNQVVIAHDSIKLAAITVSRITGDARRVLDICRFFFLLNYIYILLPVDQRYDLYRLRGAQSKPPILKKL